MTFNFPQAVNASVNGGYYGPNMEYTVVPEPTSVALLGLGVLALAWNKAQTRLSATLRPKKH